jgi:hypothetical protein
MPSTREFGLALDPGACRLNGFKAVLAFAPHGVVELKPRCLREIAKNAATSIVSVASVAGFMCPPLHQNRSGSPSPGSREINSSTLLPRSLKQWTVTLLPGVVECSGLLPDRKSDAGFMWPIVTAKSVSWRIAIATVCNPSFRNPKDLRLSGLSRPCRSMGAVHGRHKSLQSVTCIVGDAPLSLLDALMTQPGGQPPPSPHRPP